MFFRLVTLTIDQDRTRKDRLDAGDTVQVGDHHQSSGTCQALKKLEPAVNEIKEAEM